MAKTSVLETTISLEYSHWSVPLFVESDQLNSIARCREARNLTEEAATKNQSRRSSEEFRSVPLRSQAELLSWPPEGERESRMLWRYASVPFRLAAFPINSSSSEACQRARSWPDFRKFRPWSLPFRFSLERRISELPEAEQAESEVEKSKNCAPRGWLEIERCG